MPSRYSIPLTKRFHYMKLVENIGVKNPLLATNLSYPRIKKKLMFCETTYQYLVANIITCWSDGYILKNSKLWVTEVICLLAGAEIIRVTHKFVLYPRIQRTKCTYSPSYGSKWSCFAIHWTADSIAGILERFCVYFSYFNKTSHSFPQICVFPTYPSDC